MQVKFLDEVGVVNYVSYIVKCWQGNTSVKSLYIRNTLPILWILAKFAGVFPADISRHMVHHLL